MPLPDLTLTSLDGTPRRLFDFAGQALLVVNVASQCGFTPQYKGLEALYRQFAPCGFSVLGFPCNQFAGQEPAMEAEIGAFCQTTYAVTFPNVRESRGKWLGEPPPIPLFESGGARPFRVRGNQVEFH